MSTVHTSAASLYRAILDAASTSWEDSEAVTLDAVRPGDPDEDASNYCTAEFRGPWLDVKRAMLLEVPMHGPVRPYPAPATFAFQSNGARASFKIKGNRTRLLAMAEQVRKHWALYGGGPVPAELAKPKAAKRAVTWPASIIKVWLQQFEDKDYAGALLTGERLDAVFYPGAKGCAFILAAPIQVEGLPEGVCSARRNDGKWVVACMQSGRAIESRGYGSRKTAEESALSEVARVGLDKLTAALERNRADAVDHDEARAAWCKACNIEDPREPAQVAQPAPESEEVAESADDWAARMVAMVAQPVDVAPIESQPAQPASVGALLGGARFSTAILRHPTGTYGIVGSVPVALSVAYGGAFPGRKSLTWATEGEAVAALLSIGLTRFQMADCSWYVAPVATAPDALERSPDPAPVSVAPDAAQVAPVAHAAPPVVQAAGPVVAPSADAAPLEFVSRWTGSRCNGLSAVTAKVECARRQRDEPGFVFKVAPCMGEGLAPWQAAALRGKFEVQRWRVAPQPLPPHTFEAALIGADSHRLESFTYTCAGPGLASADIKGANDRLQAMATARGLRVVMQGFSDGGAKAWAEPKAQPWAPIPAPAPASSAPPVGVSAPPVMEMHGPATWRNGEPVTYSQAMAAGQDAGNRSAKDAGRDSWSPDDWDAAADMTGRLLGHDPAPADPELDLMRHASERAQVLADGIKAAAGDDPATMARMLRRESARVKAAARGMPSDVAAGYLTTADMLEHAAELHADAMARAPIPARQAQPGPMVQTMARRPGMARCGPVARHWSTGPGMARRPGGQARHGPGQGQAAPRMLPPAAAPPVMAFAPPVARFLGIN